MKLIYALLLYYKFKTKRFGIILPSSVVVTNYIKKYINIKKEEETYKPIATFNGYIPLCIVRRTF